MGNGLRTQVVEVLIGAGAPRELIIAIAPDMVLGYSLNNAPAAPQTPQVTPDVSSAPETSIDLDLETGTGSEAQASARVARDPRPTLVRH